MEMLEVAQLQQLVQEMVQEAVQQEMVQEAVQQEMVQEAVQQEMMQKAVQQEMVEEGHLRIWVLVLYKNILCLSRCEIGDGTSANNEAMMAGPL